MERRSRDEESAARVKDSDDLAEKRVDILDAMGLIDDNVLP